MDYLNIFQGFFLTQKLTQPKKIYYCIRAFGHSGIRATSIMYMLRQLRPNGIPVIFEVIYCKDSGKVKSFKQYNLSPEPGETEARYGDVSDFTMDSLRNQIIGEPIEIEAETIEGLNIINDLTKD